MSTEFASGGEEMAMEDWNALLHANDRTIWIVTTGDAHLRGGLVASWVQPISLAPTQPRVLLALASHHHTTQLLETMTGWVLHQVSSRQMVDLWPFCLTSGHTTDKLAAIPHTTTPRGYPRLQSCLNWLECRQLAREPCGDRTFFWGEVTCGAVENAGTALTERTLVDAATSEQKQRLMQLRRADADRLEPEFQRWLATRTPPSGE